MARRALDPEEVAAGAGNPGVAELVALVHRVNPTDRGLDDDERARKYALKARLQSRLVREWSDHLEFRVEDEENGVVSIMHRGHRRDAAHAVLSALDPDARSIVRRALDLPPDADVQDEGRVAPDVPADRVPDDPLSKGRRALEAWDFVTAGDSFRQAFADGRGEPAAHALLELLVEHVGQDAEALLLDVPERAQSARVARLLAVAAAREGDDRRATALLRRLDGTAEVEVRILLAERALRNSQVGTARAHLDALRAIDPANGALLRIEDALRKLDADARAPLEADLERAVQDGDVARIRAAADAVLRVAPASARARAALAELDDRDRVAEVAARLASADGLERAGQLELAITELERAAQRGADIGARLDALRRRGEHARDEHRVASAVRALEAGDLRPYLELPPALRAILRERRPDERLRQLELLVADRVRDPVTALGVIGRAAAAAEAGRAGEALELLERAGLVGLGVTRELVRSAREEVALGQRRETQALADAIGSAAARSDDVEILRLADGLRAEQLPADARAGVEVVIAGSRARRQAAAEVDRFDDLVRRGGVFQARELAEGKSADAAWARRARLVDERISRMLPSRVVEPWCDDLHDVVPPEAQLSPDACLEPDGRHAWLAEARAHFCFVRRVEVATSRVVSCTVVRTIEPFTRPRVALLGDDVAICSKGARFLVVRIGEGGRCDRVVDYIGGPVPGMVQPLYVDPGRDPGRRYVLLDPSQGRDAPIYGIWDTPRNALIHLAGLLSVHPIRLPGTGDCVIKHQRDGQVRRLDPVTDRTERIGYALRVDCVARQPRGDAVVAVGGFPPGAGDEVALAVLDPASPTPAARVGLPALRSRIHPLACSRETGLLYLLCEHEGGRDQTHILAFDDDLRQRWTFASLGLQHLLTDVDDRHTVALFLTARGPWLCPLGAQAPTAPPDVVGRPLRLGENVIAEGEIGPPRSALAASAATRVAARAEDDPVRELLDGLDERAPPADRFRRLDVHAVWHAFEIQSLARLAEAALEWEEGPWGQRLHAVASFYDGWMRHVQNREVAEHGGLRRARSQAELEALSGRVSGWLDEQSDETMGFLRVGSDDPQWPSTADA